jgi:RNA polymerase sigma-70 factor (ECF subfamily)
MDAENELCKKYRAKILYIIQRKNISFINEEDMTQDVLQDVLLQCRKNKINNLPAFIWKICYNKCIDCIRKNKKEEFINIDQDTSIKDPSANPLGLIITAEEQQILIKAFEKLSLREKTILELKYFKDLNSKEIGVRLRLTETNVRKIVQRTIEKLRKISKV